MIVQTIASDALQDVDAAKPLLDFVARKPTDRIVKGSCHRLLASRFGLLAGHPHCADTDSEGAQPNKDGAKRRQNGR
jgi:hypothetical protein